MTLQSTLFSQRQICSVHPQPPLPSLWQLSLTNTQVCRIHFSMMRSEHHIGMHSFHNILISKSPLVFLEQLQGKIHIFSKAEQIQTAKKCLLLHIQCKNHHQHKTNERTYREYS